MIINEYEIKQMKHKSRLEIIDSYDYKYDKKITIFQNINRFFNKYKNLSDIEYEEVWIVALDYNKNIIGIMMTGKGNSDGSNIDYLKITLFLIMAEANYFIFLHNHPLIGFEKKDYYKLLYFSPEDMGVNKKITELGEILKIKLYDSMIISNNMFHCLNNILNETTITINNYCWNVSNQFKKDFENSIKNFISKSDNKNKTFGICFYEENKIFYINKSIYKDVIKVLNEYGGEFNAR